MNWMTSAKNRIQQSKSKRHDNLRMVAISKLPSNKIRHSAVSNEIASFNQSNSKDMFLLCNLTRDKLNERTPLSGSTSKQPAESSNRLDPLNLLEVSPARSMALVNSDEQKEDTSHTILYFNNGHLCDEFGCMVLDRSSPVRPQQLVMDAIARSDSKDSAGSGQNEGGGETTEGDWWGRTLHMLEDGLDLAILSSVLEDLCASCLLLASPHEAPSIALRRQEPLPAPREALNGLYKALSRIGGHDRAALVVFDAIRLLELEDKKRKDSAAAGISVAPTTAGTSSSSRPTQRSTTQSHPELNSKEPQGGAAAVHSAEDAGEWCLFEAKVVESKAESRTAAADPIGSCSVPAEGVGSKRKLEKSTGSSEAASAEGELLLEDFF